jgi:spermidine/putrescine transport system substrate-binding protein
MSEALRPALIGRREFLRRVGAGGALLMMPSLLAACGDPRAANRLAFLNWQDYIDDRLLDDFATRTGIDVTYETYTSNDELARRFNLAQRVREGGRSGTSFDLMVPSDNFVTRFRNASSLAELDHDRIEGLDNLGDAFRSAEFDPGNRFSVPWATGTTGIGYDTTVFDQPPGYEVFMDSQHAGRTTILAETRDAFAVALFTMGADPNTTDAAEIEEAGDLLIRMKAVVRGFDSTDYLDDLASGELVAAHAYSSDVLQAREVNPNLAFTLPSSGALRWVDSMVIPIDAARPASSYSFISFYLEPEVAASNSVFVRVDTGNEAARAFLPEDVLTDPVIFPPDDVLDALVFTADLGEDEELYEDAWLRVQQA